MRLKRRRCFICISALVCTLVVLATSWLPPAANVSAADDSPRAELDIAEIYRRVSPSVVSIEVEIRLFDDVSGTGFVVDKQGHVVTNAHVVEDALDTTVVFQDGAKASAVLVGMDRSVDIAVLKVNTVVSRLKPITFGDSDDLAIGQSVLAIGNPFGLEASLTTGIISGLKREIELNDGSILKGMIQTDAAIAPGSSGGPLLSLYGEVIGVNSAGVGARFGGTNFGFAIPSNSVKRISERMIAWSTNPPTSPPRPTHWAVKTATDVPTFTPLRVLPRTATSTPSPMPTCVQPQAPNLPQRVEEVVPTPTSTDTDEPTATNTPTPTDTPTATNTDEPTDTRTPTATDTPTATTTTTDTPTETSTTTAMHTATIPPTATHTDVPTATSPPAATSSPTATATETTPPPPRVSPDTATSTPSPRPTSAQPQAPNLPQRVEIVVPTATSEPDVIAQREFEPTLTALPTVDETVIARLLATPLPRPTLPATWTAAPTVQLPATVRGPATATTPIGSPTPDSGFLFNPTESGATPPAEDGIQNLPPTATATVFQPTVAVRPDLLQPTIAAVSIASTFSTSSASAYQFSVGLGQIFTFQNIQLGGGVRLFLPNPADPNNSWIRTDHYGILRYRPIGAPREDVMSYSPFFEGFGVPNIDQNKNRIVELDWSADGQQFSFRIAPPQGTDTANAGVWFWQPRNESQYDPTYPIIRDCPNSGYNSCSLVRPSNAGHWETRAVSWSPIQGSNTVLLTAHLPDEGRNALAIAQAVRAQSAHQASQAPHFVRYDYGHWNPDGQGIIVSGRRPDGRVVIGEVNNDLSGERVILDASAHGLWLRDAVRRPNEGGVVALGRPGAPGSGPVALYDSAGRQISGFIGDAPPEDVRWFPNRSSVVVSVQGRQYSVQVEGGSITDATERLRDPQFSASGFGSVTIPAGVIENSEYYPGQQLRTVIPRLNIRQSPSTAAAQIGQLVEGDYVAILAGPHQSGGYPWWKVQTANFIVGWIAGRIGGAPTIR